MIITQYESWMLSALTAVNPDPCAHDLPAGAAIFDAEGRELARAGHYRATTGDPTAHAEITVLRAASRILGTWQLSGCMLVATLEPCPMCAGATVLARIARLVIGTWDDRSGAICTQWDLVRDRRLSHRIEVIPEVLTTECNESLQTYLDSRVGGSGFP